MENEENLFIFSREKNIKFHAIDLCLDTWMAYDVLGYSFGSLAFRFVWTYKGGKESV